jgi:hypothetical protein
VASSGRVGTEDHDGAVGFLPGSERSRAAEALSAHEEEMAGGLTLVADGRA